MAFNVIPLPACCSYYVVETALTRQYDELEPHNTTTAVTAFCLCTVVWHEGDLNSEVPRYIKSGVPKLSQREAPKTYGPILHSYHGCPTPVFGIPALSLDPSLGTPALRSRHRYYAVHVGTPGLFSASQLEMLKMGKKMPS